MSVIKMTDLDLAGKRVFIRADLNVPVKDGKVTSDARIRASLPTIELALKQGAKVMVTPAAERTLRCTRLQLDDPGGRSPSLSHPASEPVRWLAEMHGYARHWSLCHL